MPHMRERLHLCEHDSTVWVHFCQLEFAMLRRICSLRSCICGSEGEEERRASLSIRSSFGHFSQIWYHVRYKNLGDVVFYGGV